MLPWNPCADARRQAASACPRVAGGPRGVRLPRRGVSRRCKGIEIQPEARKIGATPKLVSGLIAVLQTQNPLGVVRWQVTRGRLALFAQVRLVAGHSGSVRSSRSGSLAADYARLVRVAHRSDWSAVDGKDACDRNPEPTQPGAAHGSRKRLGRSWIFWRAIGGRTQRVYTVIGIFARAASMTGRNRAGSFPAIRSAAWGSILPGLEQVLVHVTYTVRGGRIRLISARRASRRETRETMNAESLTRAVLTEDGRALIEQTDGSYRPTGSRTDWDRVRAMTEEAIEAAAISDPDAPPLDEAFWQEARVAFPVDPRKAHRLAHRRGRAGLVPR